MRKKLAFVAVILLLGYTLFGGAIVPGLYSHVNEISNEDDQGTQFSQDDSTSSPSFRFEEVSNQSGFNYAYNGLSEGEVGMVNQAGDDKVTNASVYANDFDNDGWTDILAIGGSEPEIFKNNGGEFKQSSVLSPIEFQVEAALFFDYDGDGWDDLLLLSDGNEPQLLENVKGQYEPRDVGFDETLTNPIGATSADFNQNGCLDLFIIEYADWTNDFPLGLQGYSAPVQNDNGNPNHLYLGNCSSFERNENAGIRGTRWSLATSAADLTGNGHPDIHVANDFNHDIVYHNQGNGTFEQVVLPETTNRNGMSSELTDINNDGHLDIYVTNFYLPTWAAEKKDNIYRYKAAGNNLLINQGNGTFKDQAHEYNVEKGGWGWAVVTADFNNDGSEDLFHTTSIWDVGTRDPAFSERDIKNLHQNPFYSYPMVVKQENGTFHEESPSEIGFEETEGRGAAQIDFDRDGDVDIVVATKSGYRLYENHAEGEKAIQFRIENRDKVLAIGANIFVETEEKSQWRHIGVNTDFLSQDSDIAHVGVEDAENADVRVVWPDGSERTFEGLRTDQRHVIDPSGISESISLSNQSK